MSVVDYVIENGKLTIRDTRSATVVWSGSFEAPVLQIVALSKHDGCLVLLDPGATKKPTFENLFFVGSDGSIRWKAQLPSAHDAFTQIIDQGNRVEAQTWNGQVVEVDLTTGHTKNARFVK